MQRSVTVAEDRQAPEPKRSSQSRRVRAAWITGAIILIALIIVVAKASEGREIAHLLRRAEPQWIALAVPLQVGVYAATAMAWRIMLARHHIRSRAFDLFWLALTKQFTDQVIPGGLTGSVVAIHGFRRRGVSEGIATETVVVPFVAYYAAYTLAVAGALTILWLSDVLNTIIVSLAVGFAALAIVVPGTILWLHAQPGKRLPRWVRKIPGVKRLSSEIRAVPRDAFRGPLLLAETTGLALAVFIAHATTLWCALVAVGAPTPAAPVFACYMIAAVASSVGITPGGLGTFEGTSVAMLHAFGVPVEAALAATLILRGFTFWLPMLPGLWLARREVV